MTSNYRVRRLLAATALTGALMAGPALAQTAPTTTTTSAPAPAPASASARPVSPMGDLTPSWGNVRSFWDPSVVAMWGNVRSFSDPYSGDVTAFWGNVRSFSDPYSGDVTAFWGNVRSFSGSISASWGNVRSFWGNVRSFSDAPGDYSTLAGMIGGMIDQSKTTFGATIQAQTGQSFEIAFANPLFAKYGIDLSNPQSLEKLDANTREHFFADWFDGLMNFTGRDHVDHWMNEVNWSPTLTQQVGMSGTNSTIGILDFTITGDAAGNVVKYAGVSNVANGHGAAVASLIAAPMDGKGVMGIAPSASVISYNPFDATQTAGWGDITNGIAMLTKNGATTVNASLGVPGWTLNPGWDAVFQNAAVKPYAAKQMFVIAAGNDGVVQTANVPWHPDNPQLLIVGSVDPTGKISSFSNQPGTACFVDPKNNCMPGMRLMDRFLVAPGELILVSDGAGGVTRYSGTSFAAPLVSGTIALIQDRWPWLTDHPKDVGAIILKSARDLGAPGVDPVYGAGELDVQAALSPLDWSKLTYKQVTNGVIKSLALKDIQATTAATRATWEANSVYFSLFEDTGESNRDFQVPLSSKLSNQTVAVGGSQEQFMSYLTSRFQSWIGAPTKLADGEVRRAGFTDLAGTGVRMNGFGDAEVTLTMRARTAPIGFKRGFSPVDTAVRLVSPDRRFAAEFGNGQGANAVAGQNGFGLQSDYDVAAGGANPFVGFASGGGFGKVEMALAPGLSVSSGVTARRLERSVDGLPAAARQLVGGRTPYTADAATVNMDWRPSERFSTTLGYTMLHEGHAVLGMGSSDDADLAHGSTTDAATVGAELALSPSLSLAGSATIGRTRAGDPARDSIAVGRSGLVSSAFQVALAKQGLIGARDNLRVSFAQPLHVERGAVDISSVQVVDRQTGALGVVTQGVAISAPQRRYVAEVLYGRSMLGGRGAVSLFGRANIDAAASDQLPAATGGATLRLAF